MPDLILYNGKLLTQDPGRPQASAVAIHGNRIRAVGGDQEILDTAGKGAHRIDLEGHLVLPGLTDSHFHLYDWTLNKQRMQLADVRSLDDLLSRLARAGGETPSGDWILGQGWNETDWPEAKGPSRQDLDAVSRQHPIILWRCDMHLAVANTPALERAGIHAQTLNPAHGLIDRDDSGQPTGVLRESAINLAREAIPQPSEAQSAALIEANLGELHQLGLTGVHDFRIMGGQDGPPAFRAYQRLHSSHKLRLRVWMNLPGERLDEAIALGLKTGFGDDTLRVGHLKYFSDGSQGARTAWMLEPYLDRGGYGMPLTPMEEISTALRRAHEAGLAVAIHAIGDRANRELVEAFEELYLSTGKQAEPLAPHRIEHVQNIRPQDLQRMAGLGVAASVQPIHITDDYPMIEASVGERGRYAYPLADMVKAGLEMVFGSDGPVADANPLAGIHAAVTRQRRDGSPAGGWYPDQRISVEQAIHGYTLAPARLSARERDLGSLSPGKLADLIMLDRDITSLPPEEIAEARVAMTVFDGQMVFDGR
jgi:predicted amidohydrolase YtcJ